MRQKGSLHINLLCFFCICLSANVNAQLSHHLQGENVRLVKLDFADRPVVTTNNRICHWDTKFECSIEPVTSVNNFLILDNGDIMLATFRGAYHKAFDDFIPLRPPMQGFVSVFDVIEYDRSFAFATDKGIWKYSDKLEKIPTKPPYDLSENTKLLSLNNSLFSVVSNALVGISDTSEIHVFDGRIIHALEISGKAVIALDLGGIVILENGQQRKLNFPGMDIGNLIRFVKRCGDDIIIYSEKGLFKWRESSNDIFSLSIPSDLYRYVINDVEIDRWGRLSVATNNGLYQWNTDDHLVNTVPVFLSDETRVTTLQEKPYYLKNNRIEIPETEDALKWNFKTFHSSVEPKIEYQINSSAWKSLKKNEALITMDLMHGENSLAVRASSDGKRFTPPVRYEIFRVHPKPVYNFLPFALTAVGLLLLIWWAWSRYQNSQKKILQERDRLKLENEKLKLEHQSMQLQMNPHFLFNALNSIQGLIALGDNKEARARLKDFSLMMRGVLQQSRDDKISLAEEIKFLKQYLTLEQLCRNNKFNFEIQSFVANEVFIPPLIIQAFVENAIVHGVSKLNRRGKVKVVFNEGTDHVLCVVDDDGVGRTLTKVKDPSHKSVALNLVNERLRKFFGNKSEYVTFVDKMDENENSLGTTVNIKLPKLN